MIIKDWALIGSILKYLSLSVSKGQEPRGQFNWVLLAHISLEIALRLLAGIHSDREGFLG